MKAYKYLQRGWCQGAVARDVAGEEVPAGSPEAVAWCLTGALQRAYGFYNLTDKLAESLAKVEARLRGVGGSASEWNDAPDRTQGEVVALLWELNL